MRHPQRSTFPSTVLRSVGVLAVAAILAACGSSSSDTAADTSASDSPAAVTDTLAATVAGAAETDSSFNDADVAFAQNMVPHHQQAVEMADIALDDARGASSAVKDLATQIKGAQQPEIDLMNGWLATWGKSSPATVAMAEMEGMEGMDSEDGMDHSSMVGMQGMMTNAEMSTLSQATGPAFDTAWLEMMIRHHQGAISMAKTVQTDGANPDARALAAAIMSAQEAEIAEMTTALDK